MGKTIKGKEKAKAKVDRAKRKIARKVKASVAVMACILGLVLANGCASSEAMQPAKSMTMNNEFKDCVFVVATQATVSNRVVHADGTADTPAVEMFTQAQSLESSGTESYAPTATQTPTTDVKPDLDVRYNDAVGTGGNAVSSFLSSLTTEGAAMLRDYVYSKKSGKITVTKKDGTTETLDCDGGNCTTSSGLTINASNCKDCTAQ